MLRDVLQSTGVAMLNDNVPLKWLIVVFRSNNDNGNLVCCGTIITTRTVLLWIEHCESNCELLIVGNSFPCCAPILNQTVDFSKDSTQQLKDLKIQIGMSFVTEL